MMVIHADNKVLDILKSKLTNSSLFLYKTKQKLRNVPCHARKIIKQQKNNKLICSGDKWWGNLWLKLDKILLLHTKIHNLYYLFWCHSIDAVKVRKFLNGSFVLFCYSSSLSIVHCSFCYWIDSAKFTFLKKNCFEVVKYWN